jgi:hypothetical protein
LAQSDFRLWPALARREVGRDRHLEILYADDVLEDVVTGVIPNVDAEGYSRKRSPPAARRRALELLAASGDGCTEAIMIAHGFKIEILDDLVLGRARNLAADRQALHGP